jgi:ferredoxin
LCYCPTCFVDESDPQWVGKSIDPTDTMTFHFLRAYHCAGRCTDCGACERACPVGIPVRQFTKKLNKDALELFSWEAGLSSDQRPPLDVYRVDDYNDFVK